MGGAQRSLGISSTCPSRIFHAGGRRFDSEWLGAKNGGFDDFSSHSLLAAIMGQAASDPIGSARQLKDQDLAALWKSQIGPDGHMAPNVCSARDQDGRSALHIASAEGTTSSR